MHYRVILSTPRMNGLTFDALDVQLIVCNIKSADHP